MSKPIPAKQLQIYKSDGTAIGAPANSTALASGTTYYCELFVGPGGTSAQLEWDAAIIADVTAQTSNHPETSSYENSKKWSNESALGTLASIAGGSADSAMIHVVDQMAGRLRLAITTGGTGGVLTVYSQGGGYH